MKRKIISQTSSLGFHVSLRGCTWLPILFCLYFPAIWRISFSVLISFAFGLRSVLFLFAIFFGFEICCFSRNGRDKTNFLLVSCQLRRKRGMAGKKNEVSFSHWQRGLSWHDARQTKVETKKDNSRMNHLKFLANHCRFANGSSGGNQGATQFWWILVGAFNKEMFDLIIVLWKGLGFFCISNSKWSFSFWYWRLGFCLCNHLYGQRFTLVLTRNSYPLSIGSHGTAGWPKSVGLVLGFLSAIWFSTYRNWGGHFQYPPVN